MFFLTLLIVLLFIIFPFRKFESPSLSIRTGILQGSDVRVWRIEIFDLCIFSKQIKEYTMARTKSKKDNRQNGVKAKASAPAKKSAPPQDDSASEMSDLERYDAPAGQDDMDMSEDDKDAAEEELERAVFGDSMGFRAGLASFGAGLDDEDSADGDAAASGDEQAYDNLADADLFFTDVGASTELQPVPATEEEEEEEGAAWQDSDDERMVVSLASVPRLRKLRRTEAEDVISGKDYVRRLRKQYADHTSSLPLNLLTLF